jgi:hypothetical protein
LGSGAEIVKVREDLRRGSVQRRNSERRRRGRVPGGVCMRDLIQQIDMTIYFCSISL